MKNMQFSEERRRKSEYFTDDEISCLGIIWAAFMTLIALIHLFIGLNAFT